jgi:hypothetical protein
VVDDGCDVVPSLEPQDTPGHSGRFTPGTMAVMNDLLLTALHLGGLHPFERALVLVVAFGPFVVLGVVVHVLRRRDIAAEREREHDDPASGS